MFDDSETGESSNMSSASSPSLLTNLRHFRFQKKVLPKLPAISHRSAAAQRALLRKVRKSSLSQDSPAVEQQPRKKVRPLVLTDDEEDVDNPEEMHESPQPSPLPAITISDDDVDIDNPEEMHTSPQSLHLPAITISDDDGIDNSEHDCYEKKLKFLQGAFPNMDKMVLQDKLICSDWNVDMTMAALVNSPVKAISSAKVHNRGNVRKSVPINNHKKRKKGNKQKDISGGSSDEEDNAKYNSRTVYNSSDSEVELDEPTEEQNQVLQFLSNATDGELMSMANCSAKKLLILTQLKPFKSWKDLVEKLQRSKGVSTDILASAQDTLRSRHVVNQLMKKCVKLATQMETAVKAGVTHVTKQPSSLTSSLQLASYQLVGLNWLITMHEQGLNGILADEMGLGKTVQVIALLAHLAELEEESDGPHLVVVPSSTLDNWQNEFERWCPSLRVAVYYGSQEERRAIRINWLQYGHDDVDVILSTYNIVAGSPEEKKMFRCLFNLNYVILDEAHMLKNMATTRYETLMRLKPKHRVLLTGTPLQNTLLELMSLLIFVMPHMFSGKKDYIKSLFSKNTSASSDGKVALEIPRFEQAQVAQARRIMKPFVLRRLKIDVLKDLPPKTEEVLMCTMLPRQRQQYQQLMSSYSRDSQALETNLTSSMAMMMQLRKLANHPALLRYHYTSRQLNQMAKFLVTDSLYKAKKKEHIIEDLEFMSDFELHQLACTYKTLGNSFKLPDSVIENSSKFQKLDELLPKLKSDSHRVLIFSQFVIMLDVLEAYMQLRKHSFLRLDGSTQVSLRQELIDEFNQDPSIFVFLLSTRAGGLGINLTAADTVLIHDMDFNPYNDKQAEDRCHRMGQTRPVTVIRLVMESSIEEGIYQVAQEKLHLEREINSTEDGPAEAKSIVRLLKQALTLDTQEKSPMKSS